MTPKREPILEAIVLAAGAGARFGGGKLLARFGEGTVLSAAVGSALAAPVRRVTLVVGCAAEAIAAEGRSAAARLGRGGALEIVSADDWAEGMASSLRAGIGSLGSDVDAAFVFLGDMPRVSPGAASALAAAFAGKEVAACPVWGGHKGNPALIGRSLFAELASLKGDQGARKVLDRLGPALALVPVDDPGVLQDVDTPADLVSLASR